MDIGDKNSRDIGRRTFLRGVAAAGAGAASGRGQLAADDRAPPAADAHGLVTRETRPDNLEFPFSSLDSFLTPNALFYVRSHFEVPALAADSWRLKVEGAVERTLELSLGDLRTMPSRTVTALLECSGNSRVFLKPPQIGVRWERGAVSNTEWLGVPLAAVLERAGIASSAVEVVLEGADKGQFRPPQPKTPGVIPYSRSLPLEKANTPDVLLAYQMNGRELAPPHGFPLRAVVPGWYGMASVKWLRRIIVVDRQYHGYFQTFMYSIWERRHGLPTLLPVTELQVKAEIARPAPFEVLRSGRSCRVHGAAWTGEADVTKVEFSDDGGKHWAEAKLLGEPVRHAWRLWEYTWQVPQPGRRTLLARATDSNGRVQPLKRDQDRRDAMISHALPVDVEVQ